MAEFEIPNGQYDDMDTDLESIDSFYNRALIDQNAHGGIRSRRNLDLSIKEDESGIGNDIIVDTDDLLKVFHNINIYNYLKSTFFKYNWDKEYDFVGVTVNVKDQSYNGYIIFNNTGQFYTIHLHEFSKDWSTRKLESNDVKDWLTDEGMIQFEALKQHFASGGAVSFGELLAPEGMLILFEYHKLFYMVDSDTHWRISYSDFQSTIVTDASNYRQIKIKQFAANNPKKRLDDLKVRIYLAPDGRQVTPIEFSEEELLHYEEIGVTPPTQTVKKRSNHPELSPIRVKSQDYFFGKVKEDQSGARKLKGDSMVLILSLFTFEDQESYKEAGHRYIRDYVYKQVDRDQMARAILHFDTGLFTLKQKLQYVRSAGRGNKVSLNSIRPLLAQYPASKKLAITHSKGKTGNDEANIDQLIRESEYTLKYTEPAYKTGEFDDVTNQSIGIVGLDKTAAQDRLIRLKDLHEWNVLYSKKDSEKANEKFKKIQLAHDINNELSALSYYATDRDWYLRFFRDNAIKIGFEILNAAEQFIRIETADYYGEKYYQLERDFLTFQPAFEAIGKATTDLYSGGSSERGTAIRVLEGNSDSMETFLVERHPFLIDINPDGFDYNTITLLGQIYNHYKAYPKTFRDFFLNKLSRSMSERLTSIHDTKDKLRDDPMFVWELESLVSMTRNYMHQGSDDLFDKIVAKALKRKEDDEFRKMLGLSIAAAALTIASGGILAAGAGSLLAGTYAAGGLAITGKMVYDAHKNDEALRDASNIGNDFTPYGSLTQQDPSIGWLVFDLALMGLDVAAVLKIFRAVSPIAKIVSNTDEVVDATVDVQQMLNKLTKEVSGFTESHAASLEKKLIAQQEFRNSVANFKKIAGPSIGPLSILTNGNPKLIMAWVDMMQKGINLGIKNVDEFFLYFIKRQQLKKIIKQHIENMPEADRKYLQIMFDDLLGKTKNTVNRLAPEPGYLGGAKHGLLWPNEKAFARAVDSKKSQGKFGSVEDIEFAGEKAILLEPGGFQDFPFPNNTSKVYLKDGTTIVDADMVRVRNNGDGTFHGFPINSNGKLPQNTKRLKIEFVKQEV